MMPDEWMIQNTSPQEKINAMKMAIQTLEADFGNWQIPWGVINRFQRLNAEIESEFSDDQASIPVGFTSAWWGSLASFGTSSPENCNKRYGRSGNSFVAVVSFGKRLQARAVVSGGQSGHKSSPHFKDQQQMYAKGAFRAVHFYRDEVEANAEKTYHPGE
jgi:acyl-homoserine lactone acylase PvdQ